MVGEFCGTFLFLFFAFAGTQIANTAAAAQTASNANNPSLPQAPNTSVLLYIALSFGFSLMISVWIFFRVSGGMFRAGSRTLNVMLMAWRVIQPSSDACIGSHRWCHLDSCRSRRNC
jgi:aquaporin related protein